MSLSFLIIYLGYLGGDNISKKRCVFIGNDVMNIILSIREWVVLEEKLSSHGIVFLYFLVAVTQLLMFS